MLVLGSNLSFVDLNLIHAKNSRSNKKCTSNKYKSRLNAFNLDKGNKSLDIRCKLDILYPFLVLFFILAWEPSVTQVTHSYPRRLPALGRFLQVN